MTIVFNPEAFDEPANQWGGLVITIGEKSTRAAEGATFGAVGLSGDDLEQDLAALRRHADYLAGCQKVILAFPRSHQAYEAALASYLGAWRCWLAPIPASAASLAHLQMNVGVTAVKAVLKAATPYPIEGVYTLDELPEPPELQFIEPTGKVLPRHLKFFRGELMVVTGITGHGKSTWLNHVLVGLAYQHGLKTCYASFEVPTKPFLRNQLRRQVRGYELMFNKHHTRLGGGTAYDADFQDRFIRESFLFVDRNAKLGGAALTVDWLLNTADNARMRHGFDILLVDPWNKFEHAKARDETESGYIGRMLNEFATWGKQTGTIVIIVAHPGKSVQGKDGRPRVPTVFDISGSMHWGNMADHVAIVTRDKAAGNACSVEIAKSKYRDGGREGTVLYEFNDQTDWFVETGGEA